MTTDPERADDERGQDEVLERIAGLRREARAEPDHWRRSGPFRTFAAVAGIGVAATTGAAVVTGFAAASPVAATCYTECFQPQHHGPARVTEMYDDSSPGGRGTIRAGGYQYAAGGTISTSHRTGPYTSGGSIVL